jgi:hypothetical protein
MNSIQLLGGVECVLRCISPRGDDMSSQHCVDQQVLEVIDRSPGSILEEIVLESPGLTWN